VKATEALRVLSPSITEAIFDSIYDYVTKNYDFVIKREWITLISGQQEGVNMWISVNNLYQRFQDQKSPYGVSDMGSGSLQLAFIPDTDIVIPPSYEVAFRWVNTTYKFYSTSYSGYGYIAALNYLNESILKQAQLRQSPTIYNPCWYSGYIQNITYEGLNYTMVGSGNFAACQTQLINQLNKTAPCSISPCSFDGAYQPPLRFS